MGRFKFKAKHRARTTGGPDRITPPGKEPLWETWDRETHGEFYFTPFLNAALGPLMKDGDRCTNSQRVDFYVMRNAWGNWCPYAVKLADGDPHAQELPMGEEDKPMLEELLFGVGGCPLCGEKAGEKWFPKGFRWHRRCMGLAFARDAERLGSPKQKAWGSDVMAGGDGSTGEDGPAH